MKSKQIKFYLGSIAIVYEDENGNQPCPVCGFINLEEDHPWDFRGGEWAQASHAICPSCHTHFGCDDCDFDYKGLNQEEIWNLLRKKFLEELKEIEKMPEKEQKKYRAPRGLPTLVEVIEYLKNINIDYLKEEN